MENFIYPPLGPPSKQPRKTLFSPKTQQRGSARISTSLINGKSLDIGSNIRELEEFGVELFESKNVSIQAGDVIIAAKPFVYVLSTRYDF